MFLSKRKNGYYYLFYEDEICNIQLKDVNIKYRILKIRNKPNFKTKIGKIRNIPISNELYLLLQSMLNNEDFM
jgi:integrase